MKYLGSLVGYLEYLLSLPLVYGKEVQAWLGVNLTRTSTKFKEWNVVFRKETNIIFLFLGKYYRN